MESGALSGAPTAPRIPLRFIRATGLKRFAVFFGSKEHGPFDPAIRFLKAAAAGCVPRTRIIGARSAPYLDSECSRHDNKLAEMISVAPSQSRNYIASPARKYDETAATTSSNRNRMMARLAARW